MKLKWLKGFCAVCLLIPIAGHAFQNEPDGFRGIGWGSQFSANASEMAAVEKGKEESYYVRKRDKMAIGGAKLTTILYVYWRGKFKAVYMNTSGVANKNALTLAFRAQFGAPSNKPNQFLDHYWWFGTTTTISLKCAPIGDECSAFMVSRELAAQGAEEMKKAAAAAKKDF